MEGILKKDVDEYLSKLANGWTTINYLNMYKSFDFIDYNDTLRFINQIAALANKLKYYPEVNFAYDTAKVILPINSEFFETSFDFANKIDGLKIDKESQEIAKNINVLKDGNKFERRKAAGRLGKIGDNRAVNSLINALKDKDPSVRRLSAGSLAKIGSSKAVYPLAVVLSQNDDGLSYAARDALINIGKSSVPELIKRAKNRNVITRRRATKALGEIGDKRSIPVFKENLLDIDEGVRWRAAKYVRISWDDEVVEILKKLKKSDKSNKVREEATKTLEKISNDVKNLIPLFERGINAIDDKISIGEMNKAYSTPFYFKGKSFLSLLTFNPHKNRVYLYRSNKKIDGVTPMRGNPEWGVITFQNKEELHITLEAAKKSYILRLNDLK